MQRLPQIRRDFIFGIQHNLQFWLHAFQNNDRHSSSTSCFLLISLSAWIVHLKGCDPYFHFGYYKGLFWRECPGLALFPREEAAVSGCAVIKAPFTLQQVGLELCSRLPGLFCFVFCFGLAVAKLCIRISVSSSMSCVWMLRLEWRHSMKKKNNWKTEQTACKWHRLTSVIFLWLHYTASALTITPQSSSRSIHSHKILVIKHFPLCPSPFLPFTAHFLTQLASCQWHRIWWDTVSKWIQTHMQMSDFTWASMVTQYCNNYI